MIAKDLYRHRHWFRLRQCIRHHHPAAQLAIAPHPAGRAGIARWGAGLELEPGRQTCRRAAAAVEAQVQRQAEKVAACGQAGGQAGRQASRPGTHPQHSVLPVPSSMPQVWWMLQLTWRNFSAGLTCTGTGVSKKEGALPPPGTSPAGMWGCGESKGKVALGQAGCD
jgi:hypothetical protein